MIQNSQLMKSLTSQIATGNLSEQNIKLIVAKYRELLLSNLQVGDLLEGIINPNGEGKYTLEVKPGVQIPVSLLSQVEVGKMIKVVVENKEQGQIELSMVKEEAPSNLKDRVIDQFALPKDGVMKQCLDEFIAKQLPLSKESLMQAYVLDKQYQIPSQVVANLLEELGVLSSDLVDGLIALKTDGLYPIQHELGKIITQIEGAEDLLKVLTSVSQGATKEQLENVLKDVGLKNEIPAKVFENITTTKSFEKISEYLLDKPEVLKKLVSKLYDEITVMDLKNIKTGQEAKEQGFEVYNKLVKLINTLEDVPLKEMAKEYVAQIKQPIALLGTMNTVGDYFMFPVVQQQKLKDAEVYFFSPKKGKKKQEEDVYAVVALELPAIRHIEVHVHKQEKNLTLMFNVEDETIKKHIIGKISHLQQGLETLGYKIVQCTYAVIDPSKKGEMMPKAYSQTKLSHLDLKA